MKTKRTERRIFNLPSGILELGTAAEMLKTLQDSFRERKLGSQSNPIKCEIIAAGPVSYRFVSYRLVSNGIVSWYCMVSYGIEWYHMVLNGIIWY